MDIKYVNSVLNQGFDVRLAVIEVSWNNIQANQNEILKIQNYAQQRNIPFDVSERIK